MPKSLRSLIAEILLLDPAKYKLLRSFLDDLDAQDSSTPVLKLVNHRKSPAPHVRAGATVHRFGRKYKRRGTIVRPFAASLKELLEVKGLSQQDLARKIGVSPTGGTVSRWCNGISRPSEDRLKKLNSILGTAFQA